MHNKQRGFARALATLVMIYVAAWIFTLGGVGGAMDDDSYPLSIVFVPIFAAIISSAVLFAVVLPQAYLARFLSRRLNGYRPVPYIAFLAVSSGIVAPIPYGHSSGNPLATFVFGAAYLIAGCTVLWRTSFCASEAP